MRALIATFGTRGDTQPMLALAEALAARGHSVSLAVAPSSLDQAKEAFPSAFAVGMGFEEISRRASTGKLREILATIPLMRREIGVQFERLEAHAAEADVIAGAAVNAVGTTLGERFGKPYAYIAYCPQVVPSGDHPNPSVKAHTWPRWLNRLSWRTNEWLWNWALLHTLNAVRASRGLRRLRTTWSEVISPRPIIASDPALAPAPVDWTAPLEQPGALFVRERAPLSPEVADFLERGPPPVYLGFGSMSDGDPRATTARLLEAVRRAGVRALISSGWAGLGSDQPPPEGVRFIGAEPHGKLFPRCAAVVHHGGAGTTHAAARAGLPQVVMPHVLDQFYWAHRIALAGVGPRAVKRHSPDPEPLARAIRECVEDEELRGRARALGARIATNGAERVAELLERIAEGRLHPGAGVHK